MKRPACDTEKAMLEDFMKRVKEYTQRSSNVNDIRNTVLDLLRTSPITREWQLEAMWEDNWHLFAGAAVAGLAMAAFAFTRSNRSS